MYSTYCFVERVNIFNRVACNLRKLRRVCGSNFPALKQLNVLINFINQEKNESTGVKEKEKRHGNRSNEK